MVDLAVACNLKANGVTLALAAAPYDLAATTRAAAQVSHRKHEVDSPYVEGSFTTHSVRENIVEPIDVYVGGIGVLRRDYQTALDNLEAMLSQPAFTLEWRFLGVGGTVETWTCFAANYTIESSQPLMMATLALVRAQVPRLPTKTRTNL